MQQNESVILIKDIMGQSYEELDNIIRRVFFLFTSFIDEEKKAIENRELKKVNIDDFYLTALKLINLSIRNCQKNSILKEKILFLNYLHKIAQQIKEIHLDLKGHESELKIISLQYDLLLNVFKIYFDKKDRISEINEARFKIKKYLENEKVADGLNVKLFYLQNLTKEFAAIIVYLNID